MALRQIPQIRVATRLSVEAIVILADTIDVPSIQCAKNNIFDCFAGIRRLVESPMAAGVAGLLAESDFRKAR
jgi:hypothetical protein